MKKSSPPVLHVFWMLLLLGAVLALPAGKTAAQTNLQCFEQPGITNCVGGRFLQYWQQNGGLPVFGYPISAEITEQTPNGPFTVQYFQRERFELHPENPVPYDVLLGRLFEKIWQVRNDGDCAWNGYQIVFAGGNQMSGPNATNIPSASPGQTVNIDIDLVAPSAAGPAGGTWQLRASNGALFGTLSVSIVVNQPPS